MFANFRLLYNWHYGDSLLTLFMLQLHYQLDYVLHTVILLFPLVDTVIGVLAKVTYSRLTLTHCLKA